MSWREESSIRVGSLYCRRYTKLTAYLICLHTMYSRLVMSSVVAPEALGRIGHPLEESVGLNTTQGNARNVRRPWHAGRLVCRFTQLSGKTPDPCSPGIPLAFQGCMFQVLRSGRAPPQGCGSGRLQNVLLEADRLKVGISVQMLRDHAKVSRGLLTHPHTPTQLRVSEKTWGEVPGYNIKGDSMIPQPYKEKFNQQCRVTHE